MEISEIFRFDFAWKTCVTLEKGEKRTLTSSQVIIKYARFEPDLATYQEPIPKK